MTLRPVDAPRLSRLLSCVAEVMSDGAWRTLAEIVAACAARGVHGSEGGCGARLRDLRKPPLYRVVQRQRRGDPADGLHEYRLVPTVVPGTQLSFLNP